MRRPVGAARSDAREMARSKVGACGTSRSSPLGRGYRDPRGVRGGRPARHRPRASPHHHHPGPARGGGAGRHAPSGPARDEGRIRRLDQPRLPTRQRRRTEPTGPQHRPAHPHRRRLPHRRRVRRPHRRREVLGGDESIRGGRHREPKHSHVQNLHPQLPGSHRPPDQARHPRQSRGALTAARGVEQEQRRVQGANERLALFLRAAAGGALPRRRIFQDARRRFSN